MPPQVEFLFDFGSPNAYLSHRVIPEIERRTGVRFQYVPVLLGGVFKATNNRSPAEALRGIRNKGEYEALETHRFLERHGISDFRFNPHFPVNTLLIMRGAIAARREGCFPEYVEAVFSQMWREERKMDDPEVVRAGLEAAGLPAEQLLAGTREPAIKSELLSSTEEAVARGVFGSPSFFVDQSLYFGKDRLRDVEDAILDR